jgi:hypothetical protein
VSNKRQEELLTFCEHMGSPPVFGSVRVAHFFLAFCVLFFILFDLVLCLVYPMLPVSLDYPFLIRYSLTFICLVSCVPNVASFSGLPILDSVFSNVYLSCVLCT